MQEKEYRLTYNSRPYLYSKNTRTIIDMIDSIMQPIVLDFKNEREVTIKDMDYYISKGKMVSYRPLHINDLSQVIKEIVIGPKSVVNVHDVEMFLRIKYANISKIKITRSNTTYQ